MKILMGDSLAYESMIQVGSHNYARLFLDSGHEVFWLGGSLHLLNAVRAWRGNAHDQSLTESWRMGGKQVADHMVTYHPMTLVPYRNVPVLNTLWMLRHTLDTCLPPLESVLKRHHFEQADVLWLGQSFYSLSLLSHAKYRKLVYRMADSYAEFTGVPQSMNAAEEEIIERADTIFCTAHKLYEDVRAKAGDKVHYLPNGVNFEHFQVANPIEPADIAHLPRPRVLYIGMLADWFDVDLVGFAARALPQFSFIIIGPQRTNLDSLKELPNVHLMGARPYKDIPHYMKFCDVGIMPFKKTALTDTVNPIKIFEYLAAGLPAVAPRLSELESLKSPTLLTDTPDEFVTALGEAVKRGRDVPEFVDFARNNSWRKRYELISQYWGV